MEIINIGPEAHESAHKAPEPLHVQLPVLFPLYTKERWTQGGGECSGWCLSYSLHFKINYVLFSFVTLLNYDQAPVNKVLAACQINLIQLLCFMYISMQSDSVKHAVAST